MDRKRIVASLNRVKPGNVVPPIVSAGGRRILRATDYLRFGIVWLTQPDAPRQVPSLNLEGDRDIEWSFVCAHLGHGPGKALDFGPGASPLGITAAQAGYETTSLDREPVRWAYIHPNLHFQQADVLSADLPPDHFDLIINCSSIEHVGLSGRFSTVETSADGDLMAMARLRACCRPNGRMLLTVPVGQDAVFPPFHRVYGPVRLPRLLDGWQVEHCAYWLKNPANKWTPAQESEALAIVPLEMCFSLGLFVLRRHASPD